MGGVQGAGDGLVVDLAAPVSNDFTLKAVGVPPGYETSLVQVVQAERLREVIALTGFTRLDGPDSGVPSDAADVQRADLCFGNTTMLNCLSSAIPRANGLSPAKRSSS